MLGKRKPSSETRALSVCELKAIYRQRRPPQWIGEEDGGGMLYAHRNIKPSWDAMGKEGDEETNENEVARREAVEMQRLAASLKTNGIARLM